MAIYINTLNGGSITIGPSSGGTPEPTPHADTWYKYAGDTEWRTVSINGTIEGEFDTETMQNVPTTQIPNVTDVVTLEIGTDVTRIGGWAFYDCSGLTSVTIPGSVTYIGDYAFHGCNNSLYDTTTIPGV